MKKLLILLFVLGISTQIFAKVDVKKLVGEWNYKVDTGQDILTGTMKFNNTEKGLTVKVFTGEGDVFPETKVETKENDALYIEIHLDYDIIKVTLKMENDVLKGNGSNSQGEFTVLAEKK